MRKLIMIGAAIAAIGTVTYIAIRAIGNRSTHTPTTPTTTTTAAQTTVITEPVAVTTDTAIEIPVEEFTTTMTDEVARDYIQHISLLTGLGACVETDTDTAFLDDMVGMMDQIIKDSIHEFCKSSTVLIDGKFVVLNAPDGHSLWVCATEDIPEIFNDTTGQLILTGKILTNHLMRVSKQDMSNSAVATQSVCHDIQRWLHGRRRLSAVHAERSISVDSDDETHHPALGEFTIVSKDLLEHRVLSSYHIRQLHRCVGQIVNDWKYDHDDIATTTTAAGVVVIWRGRAIYFIPESVPHELGETPVPIHGLISDTVKITFQLVPYTAFATNATLHMFLSKILGPLIMGKGYMYTTLAANVCEEIYPNGCPVTPYVDVLSPCTDEVNEGRSTVVLDLDLCKKSITMNTLDHSLPLDEKYDIAKHGLGYMCHLIRTGGFRKETYDIFWKYAEKMHTAVDAYRGVQLRNHLEVYLANFRFRISKIKDLTTTEQEMVVRMSGAMAEAYEYLELPPRTQHPCVVHVETNTHPLAGITLATTSLDALCQTPRENVSMCGFLQRRNSFHEKVKSRGDLNIISAVVDLDDLLDAYGRHEIVDVRSGLQKIHAYVLRRRAQLTKEQTEMYQLYTEMRRYVTELIAVIGMFSVYPTDK